MLKLINVMIWFSPPKEENNNIQTGASQIRNIDNFRKIIFNTVITFNHVVITEEQIVYKNGHGTRERARYKRSYVISKFENK